jgi:hypothetical protein
MGMSMSMSDSIGTDAAADTAPVAGADTLASSSANPSPDVAAGGDSHAGSAAAGAHTRCRGCRHHGKWVVERRQHWAENHHFMVIRGGAAFLPAGGHARVH